MGRKIKTFAKVLIWLGIICCCVSLWFGFTRYYDNKAYFQYATVNGGYTLDPLAKQYLPSDFGSNYEPRGNEAFYGMVQMIGSGLGIVACIISGIPLYWFGCMFQRVEWIQLDVDAIRKEQAAKP